MTQFFQVAQPIERDRFLKLYRQVAHVTRLLFAPYGLHDQTVSTIGSSYAQQLYKQSMQHLEDVISKCLFKFHAVDDDQIVASMHEYVGKTQDQVVSDSSVA
jgi:hypothetical protein